LRGAGVTVAREPLTQAERSIVYTLRGFEQFRQDFAINTVTQFYNLVREKEVIANTKQSFDQADFLFRRAEALNKIGRAPELDVPKSEQQRLQAETNLRDAEENHKDSLLLFRTFLGLPDTLTLEVSGDESPEFHKIDLDPERAVQIALENRLDLQ